MNSKGDGNHWMYLTSGEKTRSQRKENTRTTVPGSFPRPDPRTMQGAKGEATGALPLTAKKPSEPALKQKLRDS